MTFRLAFAKGRGAAESMRLLETDGLVPPPTFHGGKLPVWSAPEFDLLCVVVRGQDIVKLLQEGHVDAAVASNLIFKEYASEDLVAAASLDIGACRFSLITQDLRPKRLLRKIGTRYPKLTRKTLDGIPGDTEFLEMHGCVEAGIFLGVCDAITDVVETGFTLSSLSLKEREVLYTVNHEIRIRSKECDQHVKKLKDLMPSLTLLPLEKEAQAECSIPFF